MRTDVQYTHISGKQLETCTAHQMRAKASLFYQYIKMNALWKYPLTYLNWYASSSQYRLARVYYCRRMQIGVAIYRASADRALGARQTSRRCRSLIFPKANLWLTSALLSLLWIWTSLQEVGSWERLLSRVATSTTWHLILSKWIFQPTSRNLLPTEWWGLWCARMQDRASNSLYDPANCRSLGTEANL